MSREPKFEPTGSNVPKKNGPIPRSGREQLPIGREFYNGNALCMLDESACAGATFNRPNSNCIVLINRYDLLPVSRDVNAHHATFVSFMTCYFHSVQAPHTDCPIIVSSNYLCTVWAETNAFYISLDTADDSTLGPILGVPHSNQLVVAP